jgi:sugar phosphate isomerase/epimerase
MKLGCADFTWPLMDHVAVLEHIKRLAFAGVDLGLFGNRSHLRPEVIRQDVPMWAGRIGERLDRIGLGVADVFLVPWTDIKRMAANNPDAGERADGRALFEDILEFARRVGAPGMTMNSGAVFEDESPSESMRRSAEELRRRVDLAGALGIEIRIEGAVGTNTDAPAKALELVDLVPGLKLTVDYCHFVYQGMAEAEIEPLLEHAGHVQCRGAAPGRMQVPFEENTIDYGRMIERLRARGYDAYFSMEYVWMDLWDCNRTENTMETIRFRDFVTARLDDRPYVLQRPAV